MTNSDRFSLTSLIVALVITNAWFFSQVLTYTH
jgi:hypothetical protein